MSVSMGMGDALVEELELLKAMYSEDELKIDNISAGTKVVVRLVPMTAGDEEKQLLWCELQMDFDVGSSSCSQGLSLGSSRGLSDIARANLLAELGQRAAELEGEPAIFALIEAGREALTSLHTAHGECAICLDSLSDESEHVLRTPCYHVFHRKCVIEYCQSELYKHYCTVPAAEINIACPECRGALPWNHYSELHHVLTQTPESPLNTEACDGQTYDEGAVYDEGMSLEDELARMIDEEEVRMKRGASEEETRKFSRPEAFIRLHHLQQSKDEKEKPLLRLLKQLKLDALVYYGRPALLHIQGNRKAVNAFAGTAKRRRITVSIDVAQCSEGPSVPAGVHSVAATQNGSLDATALKEHLESRGLGETAFSIVG